MPLKWAAKILESKTNKFALIPQQFFFLLCKYENILPILYFPHNDINFHASYQYYPTLVRLKDQLKMSLQ